MSVLTFGNRPQFANTRLRSVLAKNTFQIVLREHKAVGKTLKDEINDLVTKDTLPPLIGEWSHEVRELGNDSAHPKPSQTPTAREDAQDVLKFLDFLLKFLYDLPQEINNYRERRQEDKSSDSELTD